jgi:RHS repeat-associated protein
VLKVSHRGSIAARQGGIGTVVGLAFLLLAPSAASATTLPSTIKEDMTLTAAGNPYTGSSTIEPGVTVKAEPDVKFTVGTLTVKGTLTAEGTAEEPVVFTGTGPGPSWCSISFESGSGASVIDHAELSYGGGCGGGVVKVNGGTSPTIKNSTFRKNTNSPIRVYDGGAPEIADNEFVANLGTAIYYRASGTQTGELNIHGNLIEGGSNGIDVESTSTGSVAGKTLGANTIVKTTGIAFRYVGPDIPGNITGNTLIENKQQYLTIGGTVAHTSTWNDGGTPIASEGGVTVASGATLTITKGVLLRIYSLTVKGTLNVEGTAEEPVVFTERIETPSWCSISFESGSGASVIDHAELSYGGGCGGGVVKVNGGTSPTIKNSTFRKNTNSPIRVYDGGAPEIADNEFVANLGTAIYYRASGTQTGELNIHGNLIEGGSNGIDVESTSTGSVAGKTLGANTIVKTTGIAFRYVGPDIPGNITGNTLIENKQQYLTIGGTVAHTSTWNDGGTPIASEGGVTVASGATLTITKGVLLRIYSLTVKGTLNVEGTAEEPVVFTERIETPSWCSISFESGSGASVIDHAELSYGGGCGGGVVKVNGGTPTIRWSTIRKGSNYGIRVTAGSPKIEWNSFRTNSGVQYTGAGTLSAPNNDWGCANGPKPAGCGASVTSNVKWNPAVQLPELNAQCRGHESQCGEGADPVSLATGQLSYSHRDLLLTNKSRVPLELTRAYSSGSSADTGFGLGWSQTGLASATELASGAVLILRQDGRQDLFYKTGEGTYKAPSGVTSTLAKAEGTFQLTTLENTVYRFDASGRIASITDDHGLKTTYGYDANGRLATITDPSAQTLTFSYNASNHITSVKDSTGREVKYAYSAAGDLATVTDALSGVTEYTYDSEHRLKTIKDPRGNVILKNTYDGQGRVVEQLDGLENLWLLEYKEGETIVTEPEGGNLTYEFDGQDRVVSEKDQLGHTTTTSYDEAGNVDEIVKPGGAKWQFGHDGAGNLTSVVDPEEGERSYEYDGQNRLTSFTNEREETWAYDWDEANDLKKITDPAEGETTFTYNAAGQPLTATDPNEHATTFTYDSRGNRLTAKDALEHTTAFAYNTRSHLISKTGPGLKAETYARSALGDLLSVTTPEGNKTEFVHDANGMLKQVTDPAENVWKIELNAMERPTAYVDPLGKETKIEYDGNFNTVKVVDRRGKATTYAYDLANQLTGMERPEGGDWEFDYDARGNRVEAVEPRENATTYEFDLLDRMTEVAEPLEATTSYEYDLAGNLIAFTDPRENATELAYDELGRLAELKQPLGKVTSFGYDGVGNRTSRTTAEGTVDFDYDAANRLEGIREGETTLRAYEYDATNLMVAATDAQADEIEIGRDEDGRVVAIDDGRGQTVSRAYDSRGNVIEQTDGRGTLEYEFDKLSRMIELTDPQSKVLDFDYDPEGNPTKAELPNGVVTTSEFDNAGRLAETTSAKGETTLESLEYEYDPAGNRIGQVDRLSQKTSYEYDALNRLIEFDRPGEGSTAYDYDAAGNRIEAGATTYSFNDLNQMIGASNGTTYDYDDAGRLVEIDHGETSTTYDWSALDELASVDRGAQEVLYAYDAFGRQVVRDDSSTIRPTHYGDLTDRPIFDTDAEGQITTSYVQGPGGLIEQRSGEATSFTLPDAHGDVTTIADEEGGVASRQAYDPWGAQLSGPSLDMGYLGAYERRADSATGLIQMGVRPYDPSLGNFVAEDPVLGHLGIGMSVDRYLYVWDNPLNRYDLNGRDVCLFDTCASEVAEDVVASTKEIEQGIGIAKEGLDEVGSGIDRGWDSTAPSRSWVADRAQDFWKQNGDTLEDIYSFAGANWQNCRNGAAAGAASGFIIGSVVPVVGTAAGAAGGAGVGCVGLVGASAGVKAFIESGQ